MARKKKPPVMTECEVKVRGRWLPCTLHEALTERNELMRCKYCHGPVQALKESSTGARAHIEHLQSHPGCRFPVSKFSGVESRHPLALTYIVSASVVVGSPISEARPGATC